MTQEQLQDVMKFELSRLGNMEAKDDTIHSTVLNAKDVVNTRDLYYQFVKWAQVNEIPDKKKKKEKAKQTWPRTWMSMTVSDLAAKILLLVLMFSPLFSLAQLQLSVGTVKTQTRENAISVGIAYAQSLDSFFQSRAFFAAGKHSAFSLSPSINVRTATAPVAFSSIDLKATGLLTVFKTTTVSGIVVPDPGKAFSAFPFSLGVESDNSFKRINGIFEAGWVPWYQSVTSNIPDFIKTTKFGLFVQAGYKFYNDSTTSDKSIARAKGNFSIDTKKLITIQGLSIGLVGNADGWYDILRGKTYHRIIGAARIYLSETNFVDLEYQNGEGAPNFRTGEQYGLNLKVIF